MLVSVPVIIEVITFVVDVTSSIADVVDIDVLASAPGTVEEIALAVDNEVASVEVVVGIDDVIESVPNIVEDGSSDVNMDTSVTKVVELGVVASDVVDVITSVVDVVISCVEVVTSISAVVDMVTSVVEVVTSVVEEVTSVEDVADKTIEWESQIEY